MPTTFVKKMAKKHGISIKKAEKEWSAAKSIAKKQYSDNDKKLWGTVMNIFKNKMKSHYKKEKYIFSFDTFLNEKQNNYMTTNFCDFLNEDSSDNYFIQNLIDDFYLTEIDALTVSEYHNKIITEKNPLTKRQLINDLFKELNITDEDHDLKEYIKLWCKSNINIGELFVKSIVNDGIIVILNDVKYIMIPENTFVIDDKSYKKMIKISDKIKIYYDSKVDHDFDFQLFNVSGIEINKELYSASIEDNDYLSFKKILL